MRKNILGRTGLEISEIALGAGVTGGILIKGDEMTRTSALRRALTGGINWIDTAPLYGNGASEATIGRHLSALEPRPYISTKVRIERDDKKDLRGAIGPGGVADTFDWLREQGLFLASGITAAGETEACLEVIHSGRFDCAQVYYNAINPSAAWSRSPKTWQAQDFSGVMAACWRQNMGVMNIRVWAGGPLASTRRPERLAVLTSGTDVENEFRCADAVHRALGDGYGTWAQTALRFVLGK